MTHKDQNDAPGLRELHEAATPGPWFTLDPPWLESGETSILAESPDPHVARFICDFDMWQFDPDNEADKISEDPDADARLIVHLRNNAEHYIAQDARIAELEAENARLRAVVGAHVQADAYRMDMAEDAADAAYLAKQETYWRLMARSWMELEDIRHCGDAAKAEARAALGEQP